MECNDLISLLFPSVEITTLIKDVCGEGGLVAEESSSLDWPWDCLDRYQFPTRPAGSGSGGYAQYVLTHAARDLQAEKIPGFMNVK